MELNFSGNRKIEAAIISEVCSYGKQLGILTDAVLALAGDNEEPAVEKLQGIAEQIRQVKDCYHDDHKSVTKEHLDHLLEDDPETLRQFLSEYTDLLSEK